MNNLLHLFYVLCGIDNYPTGKKVVVQFVRLIKHKRAGKGTVTYMLWADQNGRTYTVLCTEPNDYTFMGGDQVTLIKVR